MAARLGELGLVRLEGARVGIQVFTRAKLHRVDEQAGDHHVRVLPGGGHQSQVTGMQVAHGGHQRNTLPLAPIFAQHGA